MIAPIFRLRLMLKQINVAESQQMGALLTGIEKMVPLIARCQLYEAFYLRKDRSEQEEWKQAAKSLASALETLYATMLSFLASAIRAYNQGIVSRTLSTILNPSEAIHGFLNKCQTLETTLAIEADNCERIQTRRLQAGLDGQIQRLKQILADLQTPTMQIDSRVAALYDQLEISERLRILEWISGISYEENHKYACQGRTRGTGEWLLRHERYREWRRSSVSIILWLHGDRE